MIKYHKMIYNGYIPRIFNLFICIYDIYLHKPDEDTQKFYKLQIAEQAYPNKINDSMFSYISYALGV